MVSKPLLNSLLLTRTRYIAPTHILTLMHTNTHRKKECQYTEKDRMSIQYTEKDRIEKSE